MHKMVGLYDLSMSMSMPALSFSMPLTAAPMVLETFPTVSPSSVPSTSQPPAQSETASPTLRTVADFGLASDVSSSSRIAVTIGGGSKSAGAIITMLIGSIGVGLLVLASRRSRNAVPSSITSNDELASETGGA